MQKIPTIFERDWDGDRSRVVDIPNPAAQWVFDGEGVATRKLDGTCCMVRNGVLYKRYELKPGKPAPFGFVEAQHDETTGKTVGWIEVGNGSEDKWHREAWARDESLADGTYELVGPKVQGNPEGFETHTLELHGKSPAYALPSDPPRDFDALRAWMTDKDIEGVVWQHPDGRMAKIKLRDFGLRRPPRAA